ncbi:hypothetical protein Lal_00023959 [Lupinus albus]|nr:hypothetical protein Lal_00023959 [Lupinus albus]
MKASKIIEFYWLPPSWGRIKINSDGAAHACPGNVRGGAIFRDHKWEFLSCFVAYYGIQNALFAELNSAMLTIEIAFTRGWKCIWLECDSSLVVDIFNGKEHLTSMDYKVIHIFREGNVCADTLANFGIS